jgi:hypothetical protein
MRIILAMASVNLDLRWRAVMVIGDVELRRNLFVLRRHYGRVFQYFEVA